MQFEFLGMNLGLTIGKLLILIAIIYSMYRIKTSRTIHPHWKLILVASLLIFQLGVIFHNPVKIAVDTSAQTELNEAVQDRHYGRKHDRLCPGTTCDNNYTTKQDAKQDSTESFESMLTTIQGENAQ